MPVRDPENAEKPVVCFCNTTKVWGGGEKWHYEMALLLKKRGYNVLTITSEDSALQRKYQDAGVDNIAVNITNTSFLNPFIKRRIKTIFIKYRVSVVLMNLPSDLKTAGPAARSAGVSSIIYRRGSAIPVKNSIMNRWLYGKVIDAVLVNSVATRETILQNNPDLISRMKVHVIYNGIDLEAFDNSVATQQNTPDNNTFVIGNVGRLVHQKGQRQLVEVAAKLKEKGVAFSMKIGGAGKEKASLQRLITEKNLDTEVELTGFVEDVKGFMDSLDVFVLPSYWEGFGYVIAEAMSARKPVVAFDISSNPELVEHDRTGFLVPPGDITGFAEKLYYLQQHPEKAAAMGEAGRKSVEKSFSLRVAVDKLEVLINQNVPKY